MKNVLENALRKLHLRRRTETAHDVPANEGAQAQPSNTIPAIGAPLAVAVAWGMGLVLILAVGVGFLNSRAFTVNTVLIEGNTSLSDAVILEKAGLDRPRNVLSVVANELEERLEAHPWIVHADALVSRRGQISLQIVEEEMVAAATSNGSFVALRADGTPIAPISLERVALSETLYVGFLDVVGAAEGRIASNRIAAQQRAVARWHSAHAALGAVTEVQWDAVSGLTWVLGDGVALTWGLDVDVFAVRDIADVLQHAADVRSRIESVGLDEEGVVVRFSDGTASRNGLAEVNSR